MTRQTRRNIRPYRPTETVTPTARIIDLAAPDPRSLHIKGMAEMLAKQVRFAGGNPGTPISVAQHCHHGAVWYAIQRGPRLAMLFLIHDLHEAIAGEISKPAQIAAKIVDAWETFTLDLDRAIYEAVGIDPPDRAEAQMIALIDRAMADIEFADTMDPDLPPLCAEEEMAPRPGRDFPGGFVPLPWDRAMQDWLTLYQRLAEELGLNGVATRDLREGL